MGLRPGGCSSFALDQDFGVEGVRVPFSTWVLVGAVIVAAVAAVTDLRYRRVPNWLTVPALVAGVTLNLAAGGREGLITAGAGALAGGAIMLPLVLIGWVGAGDMKLVTALGALGGWRLAAGSLGAGTLVGGVFVVCFLAWRLRARAWHRLWGAVLLAGAVSGRQAIRSLGPELQTPVPFAVCIGLGVYVMLAGGWAGWW